MILPLRPCFLKFSGCHFPPAISGGLFLQYLATSQARQLLKNGSSSSSIVPDSGRWEVRDSPSHWIYGWYCWWKKSCTTWDVWKPCKFWEKLSINWCIISSINSMFTYICLISMVTVAKYIPVPWILWPWHGNIFQPPKQTGESFGWVENSMFFFSKQHFGLRHLHPEKPAGDDF